MFCASCGAPLNGGKFCASCGAPAATVSPITTVPSTASPAAQSGQLKPAHTLTEQWGYAPDQSSYSAPNPVFQNQIFVLLSKISAFAFGAGLLLWFARYFFISDEYWGWSERLAFLFEDSLLHTVLVFVLGGASIALGLLQVKVWVRWAGITALNALYWIIIYPLFETIVNGAEYRPSSPLEIFFINVPNLEFFFADIGFLFGASWLLSLVLSQLSPLLATVAMLGSTIKNKRLS